MSQCHALRYFGTLFCSRHKKIDTSKRTTIMQFFRNIHATGSASFGFFCDYSRFGDNLKQTSNIPNSFKFFFLYTYSALYWSLLCSMFAGCIFQVCPSFDKTHNLPKCDPELMWRENCLSLEIGEVKENTRSDTRCSLVNRNSAVGLGINSGRISDGWIVGALFLNRVRPFYCDGKYTGNCKLT